MYADTGVATGFGLTIFKLSIIDLLLVVMNRLAGLLSVSVINALSKFESVEP